MTAQSEYPSAPYRDIESAVAAIKRGETSIQAADYKAAIDLAVDLSDLGYDCVVIGTIIRVRGYEATNASGEIAYIII